MLTRLSMPPEAPSESYLPAYIAPPVLRIAPDYALCAWEQHDYMRHVQGMSNARIFAALGIVPPEQRQPTDDEARRAIERAHRRLSA